MFDSLSMDALWTCLSHQGSPLSSLILTIFPLVQLSILFFSHLLIVKLLPPASQFLENLCLGMSSHFLKGYRCFEIANYFLRWRIMQWLTTYFLEIDRPTFKFQVSFVVQSPGLSCSFAQSRPTLCD